MALPQEYLPVVSSEAYLRFERDSETRHEFLDGVVYAMAGETPDPSNKHGDVLLNPIVIFEVLSPSTEKYDRGEKFRRYRTQIESLQDYVMVSQDQPRIEHHHRQTDGKWSATEISRLDGVLVLPSIDCRIPLAEVYRHTKVGT